MKRQIFSMMKSEGIWKKELSGPNENFMSGSGESEVTKTSEFLNRINTGDKFI